MNLRRRLAHLNRCDDFAFVQSACPSAYQMVPRLQSLAIERPLRSYRLINCPRSTRRTA
jgi:hypothetical protein